MYLQGFFGVDSGHHSVCGQWRGLARGHNQLNYPIRLSLLSPYFPQPFGPYFDAQLPLGDNCHANPLDGAQGGMKGTSIMLQPQHSDHQEHTDVEPLALLLGETLAGT